MKKIIICAVCLMQALALVPTANAGYQRTVMGYDSRGNPIIRVVWAADHLDYPRFYFNRRTYPTSGRRDLAPLPAPSYPPAYYYLSSQ